MTKVFSCMLAGICGTMLASSGMAGPVGLDPEPKSTCGKFGTSVEFVATPSEAARLAKQQEKLVFVLHVSGHFEDPRFT